MLSGLKELLDTCSTFSYENSLDDHKRASLLLDYLVGCAGNFHAASEQDPALGGLPAQVACRLRDLFDNTTAWFPEQISYSSAASHTDYVSLVAAHCFTSIKKCHAILKDSPTILLNEDQFFKKLADAHFDDIKKHLAREESSFGSYMASGMCSPSSSGDDSALIEKTIMAWIFMMLRGIAWSMSTDGMSMGEPVPSSCFDHPGNVWIA